MVEKVVKETVLVEKAVEKIVEKEVTKIVKEVVKEVVKETVIVEGTPKVVERVVEKVVEKVVTVQAAPKKPVTLRYLCWWGQYTTGALPGIKAAFEDKFPHVTIKVEEVGWGDAPTKYQTTIAAGTAADVFYHKEMMSKLFTTGKILDITDYFERDGFDSKKDFFQTIGSEWWAGKLYGWPHMFEDICVFYNKELVKKYWGKDIWEAFPDGEWDWTDMMEIAEACTVDTNGDGRTDIWGLMGNYTWIGGVLQQLTWTMGDSMFDYENMKYNFTSPTIIDAMHYIHKYVTKDGFIIKNEESTEVRTAMGMQPFAAQRTAMRVRATPDVGRFVIAIEDKFEWDCIWLPNWGKNKGVTQAGGHSHNIWSGTKLPEEAYEWIKYMGTEPGLMPLMKPKATLPAMKRQSLIDAFNEKPPEHISVWIDSLDKRGGHGDHFRHNNYEQTMREFTKTQELIYAADYEDGKNEIEPRMQELEKKLNGMVEYGDVKPFPGIKVPIKEV